MEYRETDGLVRKCVGGFYTVETPEGFYTVTARGRFRKEGVSPCAGDRVRVNVTEEDRTVALVEIYPRKNVLVRPPLANLDKLFVVCAAKDPAPVPLLIDKTVAAAELSGIEPVVVFTKADLSDGALEELMEGYQLAGLSCHLVSPVTGEGIGQVREILTGCVSAFTGNSGVGKSTLLNALFPELSLKTGEVSRKLGRGRHTTREVELYKIDESSYVADTPGFSTFELQRYRLTDKEKLIEGFREMAPLAAGCQFTSCSHTCEKGCAVLKGVKKGLVAKSRFESYVQMYQEIKDVKQWQQKKGNV